MLEKNDDLKKKESEKKESEELNENQNVDNVNNEDNNQHIKDFITKKLTYTDDATWKNMSEDELTQYIKHEIHIGNVFFAYSVAKYFYDKFPDNIKAKEIYTLSLLKTGAVDEAKKIINSIVSDSDDNITNATIIEKIDATTLAGIANIFREIWVFSRNCKDLDIARELYIASFEKNPSDVNCGINAAWCSWITGEDQTSNEIVAKVLDLLPQIGLESTFEQMVILAEAQLILGRYDDAVRIYTEAMLKHNPIDYLPVVNIRQKLMFLRSAGIKIPENVLDVLTPPKIIVFSGQMIDTPYQEYQIFPNELEEKVSKIIKSQIEELDAQISYSSASAGAEIIFLEEMLKLGKEINIVLPFAIDDFIEHNVRYAGPRWEKRFEKVIKQAHSVHFAVDDKFLGHNMLYRFGNQIIQGTAVMRGKFLISEPHLFVLWDSTEEGKPGGPADFIDQWSNIETLHVVDFDTINPAIKSGTERKILRESNVNKLFQDPLSLNLPERSIRCMMFSDFFGYSKLQDENIPDFLDFLHKLKNAISEIDLPLELINTWGDAVFAVTKDPIIMADFALLFCDIVTRVGKRYPNFPHPILARISLHSGPVYKAIDPFLEKENFYGGHINKAARLEPVTKVGQVYATQQFVSILHSEVNKIKSECLQKNLVFIEKFTTEYVGVISLAKNFGTQEVYHIRKI